MAAIRSTADDFDSSRDDRASRSTSASVRRAVCRATACAAPSPRWRGQRPADAVLRQPDLAGEQLQHPDHQPRRRAGHRAVHAADRGEVRPDQSVRADPRAATSPASSCASCNEQFGNLGLAAAAYNAGPRRVSDWLAKRGELPGETRNYVLAHHRPRRPTSGRRREVASDPEMHADAGQGAVRRGGRGGRGAGQGRARVQADRRSWPPATDARQRAATARARSPKSDEAGVGRCRDARSAESSGSRPGARDDRPRPRSSKIAAMSARRGSGQAAGAKSRARLRQQPAGQPVARRIAAVARPGRAQGCRDEAAKHAGATAGKPTVEARRRQARSAKSGAKRGSEPRRRMRASRLRALRPSTAGRAL